MSAKHTPGPWNRGYGNYVYKGERPGPNQELIATCLPTNGTSKRMAEVFANAALCSAAPDLYEVCKRLDSGDDSDSLWTALEAAIAKAEGR